MWKIVTAQIREEIYESLINRETERMMQVDQKYRRTTIDWSTHPQGQQNETEKRAMPTKKHTTWSCKAR